MTCAQPRNGNAWRARREEVPRRSPAAFAKSLPHGEVSQQPKPTTSPSPRCTPTINLLFDAKRCDVGKRIADDRVLAGRERPERAQLHIIYKENSIWTGTHAESFQDAPFDLNIVFGKWRVTLSPFEQRYLEGPL